MSVRYDPLLVRELARELEERHAGRRVRELLLDRDRRLATLRFRSGPSLLFLLHPEAGHLVETERAPGETRLNLRGLRLAGAGAPPDERVLFLDLPPGGPEGTAHRVALELMTNQWNLLLLRRTAGAGGPAREPGPSDQASGGGEADRGEAVADRPGRSPEQEAGDASVDAAAAADRAGRSTDQEAGDGPGRWLIRAALWPREPGDRVLRSGEEYRPPRGSRRWARDLPGQAEWREALGGVEPSGLRRHALRTVAWLSSVNVAWVLGPVIRRPGDGDEGGSAADGGTGGDAGGEGPVLPCAGDDPGGPDPLARALERYRRLREGPRGAWLLEREWGEQPYPRRLGEDGARETSSLLSGMARSLAATPGWADVAGLAGEGGEEVPPEEPELAELRDAMEAEAARLRRRIDALERELAEGPDPEELRSTANLILARLDRIPRGAGTVTLEGFDDGARRVELDPSLSPSGNADRYYEEAARRQRALEKIPRELEGARRRLRAVEAALEELLERREVPEDAGLEELWELAGGRPAEEGEEDEERLPYRRLFTSGGYELRVGKGAKSNEDLTFHHSHTEDVWLHARQVPGAHVILRWGKKEGNPPRRDLVEAAVVAAVNSKARHSGTVGVDWTRRKYVRSPRKSPPGAVIPRNVQTIFVEPDEALVERLKRKGRRPGG